MHSKANAIVDAIAPTPAQIVAQHGIAAAVQRFREL
jgi:hypothetical protein